MANTIKLGNGNWATKEGSLLAYNDENNNFKPLPFTTTRASSASVVNKQGLIETVGSGIPRIDFSDDANGALLLEPTATNLVTYSEDFSNSSWTKSSSAVTITSNVAPDGTINSVYNLTGTDANLYTGGTANIEHTISVYAKSNGQGKDNFKLRLGNSTSSSIIVTDKWVRYELTATPTTTVFGLTVDSSPNNEFDILIWGAQLEQNSYSTSYIKTVGTTQTRSGEDAIQDLSNLVSLTEGVIYIDTTNLGKDNNSNIISQHSVTDTVFCLKIDYSNKIAMGLFASGVNVSINSTSSYPLGARTKIALHYKSGNMSLYINGSLEGTNGASFTLGSGFASALKLIEGTVAYNAFPSKSIVSEFKIYNTALTDAELISLTTI